MKSEEQVQSFFVGQECVVIVETSSGDAAVSGWSESRVEVESPASEATVWQEGTMLRIAPRHGGASDIRVRVPHHSSVVLRLVSGDADVRDIAGQVNVQTTSGDVEIKHVRGALKVHSISGDLEVRQSALSNLSIDTVSGDLKIETALDPHGEYDVRGVSGDLELRLPGDQGCTIQSSTLSGDFESELPHEIVQKGWGNLEVRINGGGPVFHVRSASGDISVTASKETGPQDWAAEEKPVAAARPVAQMGTVFEEPGGSQPTAPVRETKPLPPLAAAEPFSIEEKEPSQASTEGIPLAQPEASPATRRMHILKEIEEGRISVSEGLARLRLLD